MIVEPGKVIGQLTILGEHFRPNDGKRKVLVTRCSCGRVANHRVSDLQKIADRGCTHTITKLNCSVPGCTHVGKIAKGLCLLHYQRAKAEKDLLTPRRPHKDGRTEHPLYTTWCGIRHRCNNPNGQDWHLYGGRGIKLCERWTASFWHFVEDMGPKPDGLTVDRIDVNGDYEPGNCRWATSAEQHANVRPEARRKTLEAMRAAQARKRRERLEVTEGDRLRAVAL